MNFLLEKAKRVIDNEKQEISVILTEQEEALLEITSKFPGVQYNEAQIKVKTAQLNRSGFVDFNEYECCEILTGKSKESFTVDYETDMPRNESPSLTFPYDLKGFREYYTGGFFGRHHVLQLRPLSDMNHLVPTRVLQTIDQFSDVFQDIVVMAPKSYFINEKPKVRVDPLLLGTLLDTSVSIRIGSSLDFHDSVVKSVKNYEELRLFLLAKW